jgi:hypothetical protein
MFDAAEHAFGVLAPAETEEDRDREQRAEPWITARKSFEPLVGGPCSIKVVSPTAIKPTAGQKMSRKPGRS